MPQKAAFAVDDPRWSPFSMQNLKMKQAISLLFHELCNAISPSHCEGCKRLLNCPSQMHEFIPLACFKDYSITRPSDISVKALKWRIVRQVCMIAKEYHKGMDIVWCCWDAQIGLPQRYIGITRDGCLHDRCAAVFCDYYRDLEPHESRSVVWKVNSIQRATVNFPLHWLPISMHHFIGRLPTCFCCLISPASAAASIERWDSALRVIEFNIYAMRRTRRQPRHQEHVKGKSTQNACHAPWTEIGYQRMLLQPAVSETSWIDVMWNMITTSYDPTPGKWSQDSINHWRS